MRLYSGEKYFRLRPLAYVDGTFRYMGEPEPRAYVRPPVRTPDPAVSPAATTAKGGSGGNVVAAKLIKQVKPVYPDRARGEHVQGVVRMHGVIGKDGSVTDPARH